MNRLANLAHLGTELRGDGLLDDGVAAFATSMDELLAGISTRQEERA
jgi:hypothetical protein